MDVYCERLADQLIGELLGELPALAVVGPRASGKTTTAMRYARTVLRLDRSAEALAVAADPDSAIEGLPEPVLLDEWQEVPQVLGAVKRACDTGPAPGRFILTGSVRAEVEASAWPGTGRVTKVKMYPMTIGEQLGLPETPLVDRIADDEAWAGTAAAAAGAVRGSSKAGGAGPSRAGGMLGPLRAVAQSSSLSLRDYVGLALRGGFPQIALSLGERARRQWLDTYAEEIVTRDSQLASAAAGRGAGYDSVRLARYFEAYALNSAGVVNDTTLWESAGVNRQTALRYLHLLNRLHIVQELPAWTSNRLKRLSRAPKRFLVDPSLLAAVTGLDERSAMRDGNLLGRLLETFAVAQLRAQAAVSGHRCRLYHLRQHHGRHEVDVVAELDARRLIAFEVKAAAAPSDGDARHLAWLRDQAGDQFLAGIVLHTGPSALRLGDRLWALPISSLWTSPRAGRRPL